jgi:peptidoglycan/LPS O-acetylase OafA/YrhL
MLLLGAWMTRARARGTGVLLVALTAAALIFPWLERVGAGWPLPVYSLSPLARWPEFLAGIGLAGLMGDWHPRDHRVGLGLFAGGLVWLVVTVVLRGVAAAIGLHLLPLALPGFVLMVAGCWALRGHASAGLDSAALVLLGEASYALYLFHAPLHGYLLAIANRVVGRGYDGAWGLFVVYLAVAVALAVLVHRRFELPWRRHLRARFGLAQRAG